MLIVFALTCVTYVMQDVTNHTSTRGNLIGCYNRTVLTLMKLQVRAILLADVCKFLQHFHFILPQQHLFNSSLLEWKYVRRCRSVGGWKQAAAARWSMSTRLRCVSIQAVASSRSPPVVVASNSLSSPSPSPFILRSIHNNNVPARR